ncbi:MAG: TrkH family potassium uptake protein [Rickettsiaceae bacterium H1]|nr:TrkH family potassium uptake protein [Rickettsiaceae bacterium H1]
MGNTKRVAGYITLVYLTLITMCGIAYVIGGMSIFDGICHSLSTISTGGFTNYNNSFTYYHSYVIDYTAVFFMILAALPFVLYIKLMRGDLAIFRDEQVKWLLLIIVIFSVPVLIDAGSTESLHKDRNVFFNSLRLTLFNVTSILTSTGLIEENYSAWKIGSTNVVMLCLAGVPALLLEGLKFSE